MKTEGIFDFSNAYSYVIKTSRKCGHLLFSYVVVTMYSSKVVEEIWCIVYTCTYSIHTTVGMRSKTMG